jgi:hypothetical protein
MTSAERWLERGLLVVLGAAAAVLYLDWEQRHVG